MFYNDSTHYTFSTGGLRITLNALGTDAESCNYTQCYVADSARLYVYIDKPEDDLQIFSKRVYGDDVESDAQSLHYAASYVIKAFPTHFTTNDRLYVYAAIPRSSAAAQEAIIVYPNRLIDVFGVYEYTLPDGTKAQEQANEDYYYINLGGIISAPVNGIGRAWEREIDPGIIMGHITGDNALGTRVIAQLTKDDLDLEIAKLKDYIESNSFFERYSMGIPEPVLEEDPETGEMVQKYEQQKDLEDHLLFWTDATKKVKTTKVTAYPVMIAVTNENAAIKLKPKFSGLFTEGWLSAYGVNPNAGASGGGGGVASIVVNGTQYTPNADGVITLPDFLSAKSVEWNKITNKPQWLDIYDDPFRTVSDALAAFNERLNGFSTTVQNINSLLDKESIKKILGISDWKQTAEGDLSLPKNLIIGGKKIYFGDTTHYIELTADGDFHFSHGVFSDAFISAYGSNTTDSGNTGGAASIFVNGQQFTPNADGVITLPDYPVVTALAWENITGRPNVVTKGSDGVVEVGQYMDWHRNATSTDYSLRLTVPDVNGINVKLPSSSGTLALISDIPSASKFLQTQHQDTDDFYGDKYVIFAKWIDDNNVKLKCTEYTVWTDKADYATSAGSVAWANITDKPTAMPASDVYAWAKKKALDAADVPNLEISKITNLQTTLDAKLDKTTFEDLFEKVTENNVTYIRAKYGFASVGFISAFGMNSSGGSGAGGGLSWTEPVGSGNVVTKVEYIDGSIRVTYGNVTSGVSSVAGLTGAITAASLKSTLGYLTEHQSLVGYATETWVGQQGYLTEHQSLEGYLKKIVAPNNAENDLNKFADMTLTGRNDPKTGAVMKNAPWTGQGPAGGYGVFTYLFNDGYGTQMAWEYATNNVYIRNKYYDNTAKAPTWRTTWGRLALATDIPTKVSQLTNDSGYITSVSWSQITGTVPTWNQDTTGSSKSAKYLQTQYKDSTNFYGDSYPIFAKWVDDNNVRFKCTGYTVWTDKADFATSATTSTYLSALNAGDNATSSANWRKIWISYSNGTTGRPAITEKFAFQTSTNTLRIGDAYLYYDAKNNCFHSNVGFVSDSFITAFGIGNGSIPQKSINANNSYTSIRIHLCTIKINAVYRNQAINIRYVRRGDEQFTDLFITFQNVNSTDPALSSFVYVGNGSSARIVKTATSTWDVYIESTQSYESMGVVGYNKTPYMDAVDVTFDSTGTYIRDDEDAWDDWNWVSAHAAKAMLGETHISGTSSSNYILGVSGNTNFNGSIYVKGSLTHSSDVQLKNIHCDVNLGIAAIAAAPSIIYSYKDDEQDTRYVGSTAQYWRTILPDAVKEDGYGWLSLDYTGVTMSACIALAKRTMNHEERITALEKENAELKATLKIN